MTKKKIMEPFKEKIETSDPATLGQMGRLEYLGYGVLWMIKAITHISKQIYEMHEEIRCQKKTTP